jgi:hypothetical protein
VYQSGSTAYQPAQGNTMMAFAVVVTVFFMLALFFVIQWNNAHPKAANTGETTTTSPSGLNLPGTPVPPQNGQAYPGQPNPNMYPPQQGQPYPGQPNPNMYPPQPNPNGGIYPTQPNPNMYPPQAASIQPSPRSLASRVIRSITSQINLKRSGFGSTRRDPHEKKAKLSAA